MVSLVENIVIFLSEALLGEIKAMLVTGCVSLFLRQGSS